MIFECIKLYQSLLVSGLFIDLCACVKYVAINLSRLAMLWLVTRFIKIDWNLVRSTNSFRSNFLYFYDSSLYFGSKVIKSIPNKKCLLWNLRNYHLKPSYFRHIRVAITFLVVPFIPSSHLLTIGFVVADRVLYIPSLGYCLLISIGLQTILPTSPKIVQTFYVMLLVTFMMRSNERSIDWQNNSKLFTSAIRVCPNNAKIYYNLGQISALKGNHNKSLEYNLIANELNPNNIGTLINLGNAHRHVGNVQAALHHHKDVTSLE